MENEANKKNGGETKNYEVEETFNKKLGTDFNYRPKYLWYLVLLHIFLHLSYLVAIHTIIMHARIWTFAWGFLVGFIALMGIGGGAHRYYSHKAFKATPALQILILLAQTMAGQNSMLTWVRDHIAHHKYSDTDADPHNASRGFFYAHMGWLMVKKHPLTLAKQKQLDVSELLNDKYIMFQYKYFIPLYAVMAIIIPVSVPMYFWNETLWNSFFVAYIFAYVTSLHLTWCINSIAHLWGTKPFDKRIKAKESLLMIWISSGEGYHNFHHAFPWDYRMSEYGRQGGITTKVIDMFAYFGMAYDLKVAHPDLVIRHLQRHGDENGTAKQVSIEEYKMKEAAFKKMKGYLNPEKNASDGILEYLKSR